VRLHEVLLGVAALGHGELAALLTVVVDVRADEVDLVEVGRYTSPAARTAL
jgi:lipoate synthase